MSFLTPLAFLGAALAGPIILLYMLRLRRREVLVSSTFLWSQVLQDNEANTPWQRLRRNLLLLLQLLILALLILALARPFIIVPAITQGQIALLLDASASMNAEDANGEARFEAAKAQALEIINTMSREDSMTLIRVAEVPEVLVPETQDQTLLRDAVNAAQPSTSRADWNAALTLAAGTADTEEFSLVIVGDGGLGDNNGLPGVQGDIRYVPVGSSSGNVAITALATRSLGGQPPQLFAQITNYGTDEAEIVFDLTIDGEIFTAERYTVPGGDILPIVSNALPEGFGVIEAGLTPASGSETQDYLVDDNTAWAVADNSGITQALVVSAGNVFVDRVLGSLPTVRHINGNPTQALPQREFDLYVFDSYLPDTLPNADMLIINPPRSTELFTLLDPSESVENPVVKPGDDRTAFVDFDSINLFQFTPITVGAWAESLISVDGGTLLWSGENNGRQITILTFALGESDLPLQITWPILMNNLINWYRPEAAAFTETAIRTGESLAIRPPVAATRIRVTKPNGDRRDFDVTSDRFIYADTDQLGVYTVQLFDGSRELQSAQFAVNLFDANESDIQPQATVQLGDVAISETVREEVGQREFWGWFAMAAIVILMVEWFIYHQRMSGSGGRFVPLINRQRAAPKG